ncbi:probable ATP-dependent RNA helicase DDX20 [Onthophagus taurus]|uniref:probable ATP-dependent RNA helicase DDX20 n=1 Tax=Onthophagus taurus TaxID=166361 RepID=UPI0039BE4875
MSKAHNLEEKERTKDVIIEEKLNFKALLLSEATLSGLEKHGYHTPSPIQLKAIPIGKCGFDLIVKSKSGTGKTLVFGLIALEALTLNKKCAQVLILAPTREIAVQIQLVIQSLGSEYKGLVVECFIGGLPIEEDKKRAQKCHIAVGAPGRVRHLIQIGVLNVNQVKLFVLDEVDKLTVQNGRADIEEIASKLPTCKQTIAVSATLSKETEDYLEQCMSSPTLVEPSTESPLLLGIKQFVDVVKTNLNIVHQLDIKSKELIRLLSQISFTQCLVFTNYQTRAASVCNHLNRHGWNSLYISADQKQSQRLFAMEALKRGQCRILLSTDLTARGIDASNVDLTINYDVPYEANTYLHRMGRAGRYGAKGICVTIATEEELTSLKKLLGTIAGGNFLIARLPNHGDLPSDLINFDGRGLEFEQSLVAVNNAEENRKLASSVIDLKTSNVTKKCKSNKKQELNTDQVEEATPELESLLTLLTTPSNISNNENDPRKKRKRTENNQINSPPEPDEVCNKNVSLFKTAGMLSEVNITDEENNIAINKFEEALNLNESFDAYNESQILNASNKIEELSIENIFKLSYDYATKPNAPNWAEVLGVDLNVEPVLDEEPPKEVITFVKSPKKRYKSSKQRKTKNLSLNNYYDDDTYSNTESSSNQNNTISSYHEKSVNNTPNISETVFKTQAGNCDHEYYENQHFIDCFQRYSDELNEKMQTFADVESFESWYHNWQWQIESVREYIQQNIYVQEMNKYMAGNM